MTHKLTVDDILREEDTDSEPSIAPSFTLEDLLNEQELLEEEQADEDFDDIFEDSDVEVAEEVSDTKPSKRSETIKSVSLFEAFKPHQLPVEMLRTTRIRSSQLKQEILGKNMTYTALQTVSAVFDINIKAARGVSVPTCVFSTSSKFLAIGTTLSNIALFEVGVKDFKILKDDSKTHGKPTSICISDDNKWLVGSFQSGSIVLWDTATTAVVKVVLSLVSDTPQVLKVQFWKGNSDFLSLDTSGNVVLHTIEKYLWTGVRSRKLFQTSSAVYHDARTTALENGHIVLALAQLDFVYLIRMEPSLEVITKLPRPIESKSSDVPVVEFGKGRTYELAADMLIVSWGRVLLIYKYNGLNRGDKLFELERQLPWSQPICNLQMLALNMLLVVDTKNSFVVVNISQDLDKGAIKNQTTLDSELYYQRVLRDSSNEPLRLYSNSVCKCVQDFKEVFLLTKNSVIRGRLHRWTEFIRYLIQERQWDQILKASIEIFYGRLDIFAEKVVISPTTVMLFNELSIVYLKSRLEELQDRKSNSVLVQVQEILDTTIEFCLELKLYRHLFQTVFEVVGGYGLTEQFFDSLGNFISLGKVPEIPSKFVLNALIEYFVGKKIELVDRLVASLRPQSLDYASTIQVCHKHKLFYSQMYVSQLSGDFVTPLNEVLAECRRLSDQGSNEQLEQLLRLIYSFLLGVLQGKTITGVPFTQQLHEAGLRKIVVWYLIRQNADFLINEDAVQYFDVLATIMTNPMVCEISDSITLTVSLAQYTCESIGAVLDAIGKESYRQLFGEALVKISGVWELQTTWVMYVLEHLKPMDEEWLTKFINKNFDKMLAADTDKLYLRVLPKGVLADILLRQEHYTEAIEANRQLNDQHATERLFQRIPEECLLSNLQQLVETSPRFAADALYNRLSSESIDSVVAALPNSVYKYELMRRIYKWDSPCDIRWREENSLFYLQSLCRYRSEKRVYEELRKRDFNIMAALNIMRACGFSFCEAYLQQINCEPLLAFQLYCQVYQQQFKSDFNKILRFRVVNGRQLWKVFSGAVRMLNSLPLNDGAYHLALFEVVFKPLTEKGLKKHKITVAQEMEEIFRKKGKLHQHFSRVFSDVICQTLEITAAAVTPAQIKLLLGMYNGIFTGQFMQERLRIALSDEQRSVAIAASAERISVNDINGALRKVISQKARAMSGTSDCVICQKKIVMSDAVVYPCGCSTHSACASSRDINSLKAEKIIDTNLWSEECPMCKLKQESSAREIRLRLRPSVDTPKKDLRKSSASFVQPSYYFSYLSFDEAKKSEEDERFSYLMS